MADQVKVLVVERNGIDLEDYEEINLTASNIPVSLPGFSSDNVSDAIAEAVEKSEDVHSAQSEIGISDEIEVKEKKQMFVFQEISLDGALLVNGQLIVSF